MNLNRYPAGARLRLSASLGNWMHDARPRWAMARARPLEVIARQLGRRDMAMVAKGLCALQAGYPRSGPVGADCQDPRQ